MGQAVWLAVRGAAQAACRRRARHTRRHRRVAVRSRGTQKIAAFELCRVPLSAYPQTTAIRKEAISFSIHIPDAIFMRGLRRAKLRSQCYALRPSCDRARNPTACVQSVILVPPSKKRCYFEAASPMQVSCKPCAAQNYATNAPLRERAAIERAFQIHARDRHVWPCCCEARSRRQAIANCPARLEPRKITQPRLRVATALRPRAHGNRTSAIEKPRNLKFRAPVFKRERSRKTHNH